MMPLEFYRVLLIFPSMISTSVGSRRCLMWYGIKGQLICEGSSSEFFFSLLKREYSKGKISVSFGSTISPFRVHPFSEGDWLAQQHHPFVAMTYILPSVSCIDPRMTNRNPTQTKQLLCFCRTALGLTCRGVGLSATLP